MKFESNTKKKFTSTVLSTLMLTGIGLSIPGAAFADESAAALQFIIVSDDLRKTTTETERTDSESPAAPGGDEAGDAGADGGQSNNGHGNNIDGVDMSNPGEGEGGPNGAEDSDPEVDDEAKTGGNNGKGNGKNK